MSDLLIGLVQNVTSIPVGTQVVTPAAIGATVLELDDTIDMAPTGGQFTLGDSLTVYGYDSSDDDESTIVLTAPLSAALAEGASIWVYPPRVEVTALVVVDGESDPVPAVVPMNWQDVLRPGVREEEDREKVVLARDGEFSWSVDDLPGQVLDRDNVYSYKPSTSAVKGSDDDLPDRQWTTVPGWFVIQSDRITLDGFTHRFTVLVDGTYDIRFGLSFSAAPTNRRAIRIHYWDVDGSDLGVSRDISTSADTFATLETSQFKPLKAGQQVSFDAWQNSGATLQMRGSNIALGPPLTDCTIRWDGPL